MDEIIRIKSIAQIFTMFALPPAKHPLAAVVELTTIQQAAFEGVKVTTDFYGVMFKIYCSNTLKYGRKVVDFQDGSLMCTAPNQVLTMDKDSDIEAREDKLGWGLFFHPDLIRNTSLTAKMKSYHFFSYDISEALHLSEKEKQILHECFRKLGGELEENIDSFSQDIIVSNIELLLNYCSRFYGRQFLTRKAGNNDILAKLEELLNNYIDQEETLQKGLPSVEFLADHLNVSPRYLSDMLRSLTGLNAQQHIHEKVIEKAKEYLTSTNMSVSEIAYQLGFEYPQSFNKLFKKKTEISPLEFRHSFN